MKKFKLKPGCENFTVMSGADEGKAFVRGREYDRVPDGYNDRFVETMHASAVQDRIPTEDRGNEKIKTGRRRKAED